MPGRCAERCAAEVRTEKPCVQDAYAPVIDASTIYVDGLLGSLDEANAASSLHGVSLGREADVGLLLSIGSATKYMRCTHRGHRYLTRVFTLTASTPYRFLTAVLMWCLLARTSQTKTSVFWSSILRIADSVFSGNLMTAKSSRLVSLATALRAYLGVRRSCSVFGRWKRVLVRTLRVDVAWAPLRAALRAVWAFLISRRMVSEPQGRGGCAVRHSN